MQKIQQTIAALPMTSRIKTLKQALLDEQRCVSVEQALIITEVYKRYPELPVITKRSIALAESMKRLKIRIDEGELVVGNRTAGIRAGVIFPESGISWVDREIGTLAQRPQDRFAVSSEDISVFRDEIMPFWKGRTLEDRIYSAIGDELKTLEHVVKINQKDHAQGHICPDTASWLHHGPSGLLERVRSRKQTADRESGASAWLVYDAMERVLEGSITFMLRYSRRAGEMAEKTIDSDTRNELLEIGRICRKIAGQPPDTLHEAIQSVWFLFVLLHMESNASSFSPGRMDQYLYPYYRRDIEAGDLTIGKALELIEAVWLKFNQIVYLRNANSAKYFAGFPIGFNVALGGQTEDGRDAANELSFLFLKAQEHIGLPQPNLSARLFSGSSEELVLACSRVIGKGSGMPQIFNDEAVIPALKQKGFSQSDAVNYAIVGCVELTTHGNSLGWSDAAMFNLVKALELTVNNGVCLLTGKQIGLPLGSLPDYQRYEDLEKAYTKQIAHFVERMIPCCEVVERTHAEILPTPFLSVVIDDCIEKGVDVTAGGAHYNLSGIQAIQPANIADSLAVIRQIYRGKLAVSREDLLEAMRNNFSGQEILRNRILLKIPKYGNDVAWVDEIANTWIQVFDNLLKPYRNIRGGIYHTGLYTVSAHVPMGQKVGATPDGRKAGEPLADGGMSAVYGRDVKGPTALLKSVAAIDSRIGSNGTLLNMKFMPRMFETEESLRKFGSLLRTFVRLGIIHVQFNVLDEQNLIEAQKHPEKFRSLTVRVAGYTAYFTELAQDLQNEIIARTAYGDAG